MYNFQIKLIRIIRDARSAPVAQVEMAINEDARFQKNLARNLQIKNQEAHLSLRNALTDHIWDTMEVIMLNNYVIYLKFNDLVCIFYLYAMF